MFLAINGSVHTGYQQTSKELRANLRARVQCGWVFSPSKLSFSLCSVANKGILDKVPNKTMGAQRNIAPLLRVLLLHEI